MQNHHTERIYCGKPEGRLNTTRPLARTAAENLVDALGVAEQRRQQVQREVDVVPRVITPAQPGGA